MKIIIDKIEKDYAVVELENGNYVDMPIVLVPEGAKEGSVIFIEWSESSTEKRKNEMKNKMNSIFKKWINIFNE